jgi:hypothetical protein
LLFSWLPKTVNIGVPNKFNGLYLEYKFSKFILFYVIFIIFLNNTFIFFR